jgi:hypothetical protein
MARFTLNPNLMQLDDGATGAPRVAGPRTDTSQVTEADINTAVAQAGQDLEVDPVTLAYEAGFTGDTSKPINKMTAAERSAFAKGRTDKKAESRKITQSGMDPDNPMPTEDPGPGMYWANYGGVWRKYKYVTGSAGGNNNNNNNNNNGNNGNNGNGNTLDANGNPIIKDTIDTGPTLAADVFKQTLAVFFGAAEMAKPWANELYKAVSKFYKQGATSEEAFNMALLESENNPAMLDFTKRFKGIFALQKMKQAGKAVTVPTIAEYFATESKMGDMLKASNLGDLANEDFLGDVLSKGVSATEFGNRITQIFDRIDNAPKAIKTTLNRFFPYLDRTSLARALALGDKGASTLQQEIAGYEVLAAGEFQGLGLSAALPSGITNAQAQDIAKAGGTFASTLPQFGQIARARETEQKLAEISGKKSLGVTGLTSAVISKSAAELKALEDLTLQEEARFMGKAGTAGSRALASQARANRLI